MTDPVYTIDGDLIENEPLGLPRGSVRAILALSLGIGVIVVLALMAFLFTEQRDIIVGALIATAALVPQYYFKARENGSN